MGWRCLVFCIALVGCSRKTAELPPLPAASTIGESIQLYDVQLPRDWGQPQAVWIYLPPGAHAARSLPCVFVAPAGSTLLTGMSLAVDDRAEHLPYVRAGFAVVAYELAGGPARGQPPTRLDASRFVSAHAGVDDLQRALDYVVARVPEIDPGRLYAAGHSSAGTMALVAVEHEPRLAAAVAYAPIVALRDRFGDAAKQLEQQTPELKTLFDQYSPDRGRAAIKVPVFLFAADDDRTADPRAVAQFATTLEKQGIAVKLVTVPHGGHHDSMISDGIPAGIAWLQQLGR